MPKVEYHFVVGSEIGRLTGLATILWRIHVVFQGGCDHDVVRISSAEQSRIWGSGRISEG
jgi:hypothetical protein